MRQIIDNSATVLGSAAGYGGVASGSDSDGFGYNGVRLDALTGLQSQRRPARV